MTQHFKPDDASATIRRLLSSRAAMARTEMDALRRALEAATSAFEQTEVAAAADAHESDIAAVVDRLASDATAEVERAAKEVEVANAGASRLTAALQQAQEQLDASERAREMLAEQLNSSVIRVQELESTIADHLHVATALEQAQQQLHTNDRERQTLAGDLATRVARIDALETEVNDTRAMIAHLPTAFRTVSAARTMPDALTAVANGLTGLFARVALFRAKADRLEGVHQSGFDFTGDISNVVVPLTIDSVLAGAVSSNCAKVLTAADLASSHALPFGGAATSAIVLPLSVDGKTIAAVYADDGGRAPQSANAEDRGTFAEVVRDYAIAHIERIVNGERSLAELNAYAEMLLDEVERLYAADVAGGHDEMTLRIRLVENLQIARQIYAQRAEREAPTAAALLEERIVAVARGARATPFGRDVLEVAFHDGAAPDHASRPAAQAS